MNCFVNVCEKHRKYAVWYRSFKNAENNFSLLRIHWRYSTILKTSNKSVWSNVLLYKFWKNSLLFNTLYIWKKTKKFLRTRNALFFASSNLSQFYFWFAILVRAENPRFISLKVCMFDFVFSIPFFLLKFKLFDFKSS